MVTYKLKNNQICSLIVDNELKLPKYAAPLINRASYMSQATRSNTVGQMTELIKEFPGHSYGESTDWHKT